MSTESFAFAEALESRTLFAAATAWVDTVTNPYMPLLPGATWLYKGTKEGEPMKDRQAVQTYTRQVMGVTCTVVLDRVYVNNKLEEKTHDYFAQDKLGNVWYFGEATAEYDTHGHIDNTDGSFEAGIAGAMPGIVMEADPTVGDLYQQEFASGIAEDEAKVLALKQQAKVPFAQFSNCLETKEFTSLEPDVVEHKYYAKGIGFIYSISTSGESEILKLVSYVP